MTPEDTDLTPTRGRPSNSLHFIVGKIDGKLDQMLTVWQGQEEAMGKLGGRVKALETWQSKIIGGGAALTLIITVEGIFRYGFPASS